jgi:hypothetical protein
MFSLQNGRFIFKPSLSRPFVNDSDLPDLKNQVKNNLEAIVILTTNHEINKGLLSRLLDNICETTSSTDIDLIIFTNNSNHNPVSFDKVKQIFKSVNLINVNISQTDDIYSKKVGYKSIIPPYGAVSGPNILFLKAMDYCKKYNTVLALETDCKVFPEWLKRCTTYVSNEYFLMSGSTYDGGQNIPDEDMSMYLHLNGVAFYKTGSPAFQYLVLMLDKYLIYRVSNGDKMCAYDICFTYMILDYLVNSHSPESLKFWRYVFRYTFKTSLIVNASPQADTYISETYILDTHKNCVILHKKY